MDEVQQEGKEKGQKEGKEKDGTLAASNIMINLEIKEENESEVLERKTRSLTQRYYRVDPAAFNNSKLVVALHRNNKIGHHRYQELPQAKPSRNHSSSEKDKNSRTLAINSNINFQMFNILPPQDKKEEILRKKSLSILRTPQKINTYKSLSLMKKDRQPAESEAKLTRTEILKSILIQYDKNVENKTYLQQKQPVKKEKSEKSYFLTQLGEKTRKKLSSSVQIPKDRSSSLSRSNMHEPYKISLSNDQIEMIVRKSLKEIDKQRKAKNEQPSKSLISFTQKSSYLRKMRRVQTNIDPF